MLPHYYDYATAAVANGSHIKAATEGDWIRRAGVVLALVGTFVAAPAGVAFVAHAIASSSKRFLTSLARLLRLQRRRDVTIEVDPATVNVTAHAGFVVVEDGWIDGASDSEKIEWLHRNLEQARGKVAAVERDLRQVEASAHTSLSQISGELRSTTNTLQERFDTGERRAAVIDARGVVLIGAGVILTGVPDGLAEIAWIGWLVVAACITLMLGILVAVACDMRRGPVVNI